MSKTQEFLMPLKQVHGMNCTSDKVELLTFKSIITVNLDKSEVKEDKITKKGINPESFEKHSNLSIWQTFISESNALENTVPLSNKYNISLHTTRNKEGCMHQIFTYIVSEKQKVQLFSGDRMLYCGG
jgi:hypothetical protein